MDTMKNWTDFDWWTDDLEPFELEGARLVMTCGACPEQYDVFMKDGTRIGYLRLRWGCFRADYPDAGGKTVYEAELGDGMSGSFTKEERVQHLPAAVKALLKEHESPSI
jgi:hypothetical protein